MNKRAYGGPAFPPMHDPDTHQSGMSLRDYFAAKAMQALIGERAGFDHYIAANGMPESFSGAGYTPDELFAEAIAMMAYNHADAMIAERYETRGRQSGGAHFREV